VPRTSASGDACRHAHAPPTVSGRSCHTRPRGRGRQPSTPRRHHLSSHPVRRGLTGEQASAGVGYLAVWRGQSPLSASGDVPRWPRPALAGGVCPGGPGARRRAPPPRKAIAWHIQAHGCLDEATRAHSQPVQAGAVLGLTLDARALSHAAGMAAHTGLTHVTGGWRFLNAPLVSVSPWCVKKPTRRAGLLMVLTRA